MNRLISVLLVAVLLLSALPLAGAEFTDNLLIKDDHKKAVAAMAEKGIIGGFPDGSFAPEKTLTRAQAAKILCVMLEGSEKADALTKTDTGFSDVPATHWAAKFVAYCVDKGIVAGVGDGKFDPDGTLSSGAFAKMLLVAYGEDGAKFTGAGWLANVQSAVKSSFLAFRLPNEVSSLPMKRQEAAQIAWNALYLAEAMAAADKKDLSGSLPTSVPEKLKVLFIGTSGSADCMLSYLYDMLKEAGVKELTLANLRRSSTKLIHHAEFSITQAKEYSYDKNTDGKWKSTGKRGATMDDAVLDEEWDYIVVQHGVSVSHDERTYHPWQELLLYYLQEKRPNAVFGWNLNWAYDPYCKLEGFSAFDKDSDKHYAALVAATQHQALPEKRYQFVIPVGTAVQNARTSFIGYAMTRDGSHLNQGIGRYVAAMTWCCKLTGVDPDKLTYLPDALVQDKKNFTIRDQDMKAPGLLEALGKVARESVKNALAKPFEVTRSQITTKP